MRNIIILGAGLSGLSCAYHCKDNYKIYEKSDRVGGLCKSEKIEGYTFDYGPHILYSIDTYATELIHKLLKGNLYEKAREAWIYHKINNIYTRFPFQSHLYGLPKNIVKECISGLFEAYTNPDKIKPKNYKEWMYKVFGKGITDYLMVPYAYRIWTIGPEKMNYDWIKRRVPTPDIEEIIDGAIRDSSKEAGFNIEFWYPIKGGIQALPEGFLNYLKNIYLNSEATRIYLNKKKVEINHKIKESYDYLISTLPLPELVKIIDEVPTDVKKAADNLLNNSIYCVNLGIDRPNITDKHWIYFYEDDFVFHRISFPMNFSPFTTPEGKSSISTEIAYSKFRPMSKDTVIEKAIDSLKKANLLFNDDKIEVTQILNMKYAYIIYDLDHRKNVDKIHSFLEENNIISCGRFGEWEYFNMDHSIMSGKKAADKLNKLLY